MTEHDLFVSCIPQIAEMVHMCRGLDKAEYEEWKQETMEHAPEMVKGSVGRILIIIDLVVLKNVTA